MNETDARATTCTNCRGEDFDRDAAVTVERQFDEVRVAVDARGDRCRACGAAYLSAAALEVAEQLITTELVTRGVGGADAARWLRKGAGLGVGELAELLGVTSDAVRAWENEGGPDRATLVVLGALAADALRHVTTTQEHLRAAAHPPAGTVRVSAA